MRGRKFYCITLLVLLWVVGLTAQDDGLNVFDPFLQWALLKDDRLQLLREAEPGIPSPALELIRSQEKPLYGVVIHGENRALSQLGIRFYTQMDGLATARVTLYELLTIAHHPGIHLVEKGGIMKVGLDRSIQVINVDNVHDGLIDNIPFKGEGVIIGIIDTGIDFFHPDFRDPADPNKSRVVSIWDVQLEPSAGEQPPQNFDYGVEYTRDDIERELRGETDGMVRSIDPHGHGTHVAGIAGGNGVKAGGTFTGVAPEAEFIIVAFPDGRFGTAEVINAMQYIFSKSEALNLPAVVNLSIGGHGGAHDGTGGHELAIDQFSQLEGNAVVVAAGNSGNRKRHYGQTLLPSGLAGFTLHIPEYDPDLHNFDDHVRILLWYESDDMIEVSVTSPDPAAFTLSTQSGNSASAATPDGAIEIDATFPENPKGARVFSVNIHTSAALDPPAAGAWTITVDNMSDASQVKFNSWIVSSSMADPWFDPNTGRNYTVTMPGTAEGAITVAALTSRTHWTDRSGGGPWTFQDPAPVLGDLPLFSGGGPTRDERLKPNVTAPGAAIVAAESGNAVIPVERLHPIEGYAVFSGTSMATPHVSGMVALIFEANPSLSGTTISEVIENSGRTTDFTGDLPNFEWGFGVADAAAMFNFFEVTHGVPVDFYLYQNFPNPFNAVTSIRFTVPEPARGRIVVYDVLGRKVGVVFEGELEPRAYTIQFDGSGLSSGVYFYRLETERFTDTKKMMLLR